ncbi:HAMP domain-containing sensor histidine kinase [Adlercreutzia sp. ZJ304]|uniref:sensor histidine kinase n=1 Tax=Adlercreutzia sp. ZJ304 TaxID=2709791 RepID=UPI0013EC084D|nr:HAMP domain-containing sensor histidine kinase [Adlercreutzia sp. ZJ304]
MGSYSTLLKQSIALAIVIALITCLAPPNAMLWCAGVGIAALAFFIAISLWRHRQIMRLSTSIDEILHSGHRVKLAECREGDVAILSNELEKMVACLSRTTEQLQQERNALANSLADISHQIRTPLTAVELMLPDIERIDNPEQRKRAVRDLEEMLERIAWLVTTLLKIAKVDAGSIQARTSHIKVADIIKRAIAPLEISFDIRDITLKIDIEDNAAFTGDALWTAEAIENILKNCMEHTPAGGEVRIQASENTLATTITISDSGCGIAPEDLPHIFERFYRGESDSISSSEGFGIGLALARALISVQGGMLRADNSPEGGALFQIAFPKLIV